jgi:hypothetical protein
MAVPHQLVAHEAQLGVLAFAVLQNSASASVVAACSAESLALEAFFRIPSQMARFFDASESNLVGFQMKKSA